MNEDKYCPRARRDQILVQAVGEETVLYDEKEHTAYCLNKAASTIWQHCDGQTPVKDLARLLDRENISAEPTAVQFVLGQLEEVNLVYKSDLAGARLVTRREILELLGVKSALVMS